MTNETQKTWALYKITNKENNKIYIGQTVQPEKRWYQHRKDSSSPKYPIHFAINKYGAHNFIFEVIFSCKSQENANWAEEELIKQYNCLVKNGNGYNISLGGMVAPKSEEWKQALRNWRSSLTPEEWAAINQKRSEATIKQIAEKGHPAAGRVVSQETRNLMRKKRLDNPIEYTDEIRKNMSEAHKGKVIPEEQRKKMSEGIKKQWATRIDYSRKCEALGCEVSGKAKYKIIDGVRYCNKHGLRILRYGRLGLLGC